MTDDAAERAAMPPMRVARPKSAEPPKPPVNSEELRAALAASVAQSEEASGERRGPGRPRKVDPLDAIRAIAATLQPFERETRRKIIETILDLTE